MYVHNKALADMETCHGTSFCMCRIACYTLQIGKEIQTFAHILNPAEKGAILRRYSEKIQFWGEHKNFNALSHSFPKLHQIAYNFSATCPIKARQKRVFLLRV